MRKSKQPYIIEGVGKVLATMFTWIMVFYIFLPNANFKIIQVLLSNIGIGYYDAVTPLFILIVLVETKFWIVDARVRGP